MKRGMIKIGIAMTVLLAVCFTLAWCPTTFGAEPTTAPAAAPGTVRIAAAQPRARLIDWRVKDVDAALARVDQSLTELEALLEQAGQRRCDAIAFPEDTLGLGNWEAGNEPLVRELLPRAVERMLKRLGAAYGPEAAAEIGAVLPA